MNKRGLSNVITTVLIILISIAAVAILWGSVSYFLHNSSQSISSNILKPNFDVAPKPGTYDKFIVTSGSSQEDKGHYTIYVSDGEGHTCSENFYSSLQPFQSQIVTVNLTNCDEGDLKKIIVVSGNQSSTIRETEPDYLYKSSCSGNSTWETPVNATASSNDPRMSITGDVINLPHTTIQLPVIKNISEDTPDKAIDNNMSTLWVSKEMVSNLENASITVDMGRIKCISSLNISTSKFNYSIVSHLPSFFGDILETIYPVIHPRSLNVYISKDGSHWKEVIENQTFDNSSIIRKFNESPARFIKIAQQSARQNPIDPITGDIVISPYMSYPYSIWPTASEIKLMSRNYTTNS